MKKGFIILAAMMLFASAQNSEAQQKRTVARTAATTAKTKVGNNTSSLPKPGRGDLGGFDLRGPVKKCVWGDNVYTFNQNGQLLTENGQNLKQLFPTIKRDKQGRLSECEPDGYGSRYYTYNAKGLPTQIAEDGYDRTFTYDADGYVKTETQTVAPEMGDEEGEAEVSKFSYSIVAKDKYGNWTKRKDQKGNVQTRIITYFQ